MIFNFSQIKISPLRKDFARTYGRFGIYILFFVTRVAPYLLIYFISGVFLFIESIGTPDWFWKSIFMLLYGKNTANIFMSVLLLLFLKLKKDPKITVPLFLATLVIHFIFYKTLYMFLSSGIIVTALKIAEFVILLFFVIFEFFFYEGKLFKSIVASIASGVFLYFMIIGIYVALYTYSDFGSYKQNKSALTLLKMGYEFPMSDLKAYVFQSSNGELIPDLIYYARRYKEKINFTQAEWEKLFTSHPIQQTDMIARYMIKREIRLSYTTLITYAQSESISNGNNLVNGTNFIKYIAQYYGSNSGDFIERLYNGNQDYRTWAIRVIGRSGSRGSIPLLINLLTGINSQLSNEAYNALVKITGIDPARRTRAKKNDLMVIIEFYNYYINIMASPDPNARPAEKK
jgi:hypothetical protein